MNKLVAPSKKSVLKDPAVLLEIMTENLLIAVNKRIMEQMEIKK